MLAVKTFWFFGELGVNLFILTTGYFQVNGRFKWKKLLLLLAQILFYSILTRSIGLYVGVSSGYKELLKAAFPVIRNQYWFVTAYTVIYLFSPYLNQFIRGMEKNAFQRFLVMALLLYSAIPTVFGLTNGNTETWLYYNRTIWFFTMYFAGAYIRLYSLPLLNSVKKALVCALSAFALMELSIVAIYALDIVSGLSLEVAYFWPPNTVPMLILSVSAFCAFLQLQIPYTPWINRIASATFGIYLLHDSNALQRWIWQRLFRFAEKIDSPTLIPQMLAGCACIFLAGMAIDFARQALERVTLKKWLSSAWFQRLETRFDVNVTEKET